MFNKDGKLLATVDMAGLVQVWKVEDKKLLCQLDCEGDVEVSWCFILISIYYYKENISSSFLTNIVSNCEYITFFSITW